jgi:hypothetical protein
LVVTWDSRRVGVDDHRHHPGGDPCGRFDTYAYQRRKREIEHDLSHLADLERFGLDVLALADKWLELKIERMKMRIGNYLGRSDKVAVFALVSAGLEVWKNFPHSTLLWQGQAFLIGLAMLVGLAVGWMLVNRAIRRDWVNRMSS